MTDREYVVATIARPNGGELRVMRRTYRGSAPFTAIHRYYLDEESGELRPTGNGVTIRDDSLPDVIRALLKIASSGAVADAGGRPVADRSSRRAAGGQRSLPGTGAPQPSFLAATDEELREVDEAF